MGREQVEVAAEEEGVGGGEGRGDGGDQMGECGVVVAVVGTAVGGGGGLAFAATALSRRHRSGSGSHAWYISSFWKAFLNLALNLNREGKCETVNLGNKHLQISSRVCLKRVKGGKKTFVNKYY